MSDKVPQSAQLFALWALLAFSFIVGLGIWKLVEILAGWV
jgi:hypothetical protein